MDFLAPAKIKGGAVTADNPPLVITQTWNNAGVTFGCIEVDVTNTNSASGSKLFNLKVGGVSQASIDRSGTLACTTLNAASFISVGGSPVVITDAIQTLTNKTLDAASNSLPHLNGYISGLKVEYVSTTQIRITTGAAWIESSGRIIRLAAASTLSPSLSSSTWYHCYLYDNSGTPAIEVSTTAPNSTPFFGTAKSKSGDTSRRYLGSFRTNSSSQIYNAGFVGSGNLINVTWKLVVSTEMRALAAGTATSNTTISLANYVPPGTRHVKLRLFSNANQGIRFDDDTMTGTDPDGTGPNTGIGYAAVSTAGGDLYPEHPCNGSQEIRYAFQTTVTNGGGLYVDVYGYWLER